MSAYSNPAQSPSDYSEGPTALIIGEFFSFEKKLSEFLRSQEVAVVTGNEVLPKNSFEYIFLLGTFEEVKEEYAHYMQFSRKVLCLVSADQSKMREIQGFVNKNPHIRVILGSEHDVPELGPSDALQFFFSRGRNRTWVLTRSATGTSEQRKEEKSIASLLHQFYTDSISFKTESHKKSHSIVPKKAAVHFPTHMGIAAATLVVCVLVFVLFPLISFVGNTSQALLSLSRLYTSAATENSKSTTAQFEQSLLTLSRGRSDFNWISWMLLLTGQTGLHEFVQRSFSTLTSLAQGGLHVARVFDTLREVPQLLTTGGGKLVETVTSGKSLLLLADTELAQAEAEGSMLLEKYPVWFSRIIKKEKVENKLAYISQLRHYAIVGRNMLSLVPLVSGYNEKQNFLILFQNNMELRPGGGFIGSFGLVSFEQGKMGELTIHDVYTADGQLKGHVDPPFAIKTFLGQENWFLRDSNWDADFSVAAEKSAWFLEKEMGITVDGVIAVDLTAASYILSATGPLDLRDYNEQVSAENLFTKAQIHAQSDFFPGSSQKSDFLGSIGRTLLTTLFTPSKTISYATLVNKLTQALEEKHIMFYFRDPNAQALAKGIGFHGGLVQPSCVVPSCVSDYLYPIESNLGVNKANAFVNRALTLTTIVNKEGEISHELIALYQNKSPQNHTFPGGVYRNYMRVLVPFGSTLVSVKLDERDIMQKQKANFVPKGEPVVFVDTESNFTSFEMYFEVPTESSRRVTISYTLPQKLELNSKAGGLYSLTIQKQPGTSNDTFRTILEYPSFWQALYSPITGQASEEGNPAVAGASTLVKDGTLMYNGRLVSDTSIKIRFNK